MISDVIMLFSIVNRDTGISYLVPRQRISLRAVAARFHRVPVREKRVRIVQLVGEWDVLFLDFFPIGVVSQKQVRAETELPHHGLAQLAGDRATEAVLG